MQIMIGCERLQAMKCFLILYFPPFSQNFFFLTCLHTANCHCCNKTCFLGCFFPPLKHNFNHRELIFVETAFQKWDFSFLSGGNR